MNKAFQVIALLLIVFSCNSCFQEFKDVESAKKLYESKNYNEAIELLDKHDSSSSKSLNSKIHLDYSIKVLSEIKKEKKLRYLNAKEILRKALDLDPSNKEAKIFYKMLSKSIDREFPEAS